MLCTKFKQIFITKTNLNNKIQHHCLITSRFLSRKCFWFNSLLSAVNKPGTGRIMSSSVRFRVLLKDFSVLGLWSVWTSSQLISTVVKRWKRDRAVREVLQCFRQTILKPRRLLLTAAAAYKSRSDDDDNSNPACDQNISDDEIQALVSELEAVQELSRTTLFCSGCGRRLVIDKKQSGVSYCICKAARPQEQSSDGWVPYMETDDVIIWRKEYKPGQGLYAYKVYGRYKEVRAHDFAAVQVDGAYRRVWDAAVASLALVERCANGVPDQAVLHWEVMWPKLFANRDYVYIRRHKEFNVRSTAQKDSIFTNQGYNAGVEAVQNIAEERPCVHSNAKRKSMEAYRRERDESTLKDNKVYVIVSRSCEHPKVPETKHAIRVTEYWSHMVVRTLDGDDQPGMEFVLTYYDEPSSNGGVPRGVAAWAAGRAAPAYLARMRTAAAAYRGAAGGQELPDFIPFGPDNVSDEEDEKSNGIREQDMESSKQGPEMENGEETKKEQSTQTEPDRNTSNDVKADDELEAKGDAKKQNDVTTKSPKSDNKQVKKEPSAHAHDSDNDKPEEEENNGGWWRYLYPFYYFV